MLNIVWLALIVIALIVGAATGNVPAIGQQAVDMAKTAVDISLGLIGIMALWLGIMRIAHEAGLIKLLARAIKPVTKRLFPEVPPEHPAMGAMIMNIAANWLGLGNAATPLGIKAMEELQTLNKSEDTATDSMVIFLTLNTASITLIPATMIAVRVSAGSHDPFGIIGTTIFASATATTVGVIAALLLGKLPVFKKSNPNLAPPGQEQKESESPQVDNPRR
ncbi:MAG: nucleoside recognition protein [Calditrichaeota bacterium]|nr:MAG: nucleoside recognition protein [Calditrichota bacterium]